MQVAVSNEMVLCLGEEKFERTGRSSSGSPRWIQIESNTAAVPGSGAGLAACPGNRVVTIICSRSIWLSTGLFLWERNSKGMKIRFALAPVPLVPGLVVFLFAGMTFAANRGWVVFPSPNSGQTNYLTGVTAVSSSDAWTVGYAYDSSSNQINKSEPDLAPGTAAVLLSDGRMVTTTARA